MIPTDLETKLDTLLDDTAAQVAAVQENYRSIKGHFWQGARTHTATPADGAKTPPDPTRKPTDQTDSWTSFGIELPAQTEAALSVDVYETRSGHGYVVNADVIVGGTYYRRSRNFGPESWHARDWHPRKSAVM